MTQPSPRKDSSRLLYRRVLLKISGEALMGPGQYGIDIETVKRIAGEVKVAFVFHVADGLVSEVELLADPEVLATLTVERRRA